MRKWSIQSSLVGPFALFVSLVLSAPLPSPEESFASGVVGDCPWFGWLLDL
jgi:hypothetical protein